jgi:pilus assembly protein CpaC
MVKLSTSVGLSLGLALAAPAILAAAPVRSHRSVPAPMPERAASAATTLMQISTSRGRLITLPRAMSDIFIADDGIADVQVRSPTQLYVFGKKAGETTVSATAKDGSVVYAATVRVGQNYDSIGGMLGLAMPEANIVATPMNGLVLLTGTVAAPEDAAEAERLVQAYVGDGTKVLSRLKTATPLQVNLQVRIAEVSRTFAKNVGVNIGSVDTTGGFKIGIARGASSRPQFVPNGPLATGFTTGAGYSLVPQGSGSTVGLAGKLLGLDLLSSLDLGETIGQVSTLANPNLTALSGETASFLAGGEIPIPLSTGLGAVSVEFKQYGVSLAFTPTVLADGRISLRVRPEVSQLSYANAVQIQGTAVPGLTTRRVETTAELGSGQSMMIGGLLSNSHDNNIDKTPGLGDVPVLGALFRSNGWRRSETELVVIITPYLVKPVNNASDIVLPTDGEKAPTDVQRLLLGELGSGTSGARRPVPTMAPSPLAQPSLGAAAPMLPAPPREALRGSSDAKASRRNNAKGSPAMPGFSN